MNLLTKPRRCLRIALLAVPILAFGVPCYGLVDSFPFSSLLQEIKDPKATFDPAMAEALGADERGMRMFVMAFLKRGPNRNQDAETAAELQSQHMANIGRLAAEGKLLVAGPFGGDGELRGIYLFNTKSVEEAKSWTESDPAIKAGRLSMDLQPWYGSAAMMLIPDLHKRLEKPAEGK